MRIMALGRSVMSSHHAGRFVTRNSGAVTTDSQCDKACVMETLLLRLESQFETEDERFRYEAVFHVVDPTPSRAHATAAAWTGDGTLREKMWINGRIAMDRVFEWTYVEFDQENNRIDLVLVDTESGKPESFFPPDGDGVKWTFYYPNEATRS